MKRSFSILDIIVVMILGALLGSAFIYKMTPNLSAETSQAVTPTTKRADAPGTQKTYVQKIGNKYIDWGHGVTVDNLRAFDRPYLIQVGFRSDGALIWRYVDEGGQPVVEKSDKEKVRAIADNLKESEPD